MKAAVIYQQGGLPQYEEVQEPTVQGKDEILVNVKAVALKHIDKGRANGSHYSSEVPAGKGHVPGGDGVCVLNDGRRVYAIGVSGMMAEKAIIERDRMVPIPAELDDVTAAALPNAVIGAAMGLRFKADIQRGDVVLINGATGFTGRVAVQIAKHYGARKVIVTGRNQQSLTELLSLGADEVVPLLQEDESFIAQINAIHASTPIDIIIDYLWGHSAEMLLGCIKGDGSFTNRIRYVSVGSMAGDKIQLSAGNLRSVNLALSGYGLGAWSKGEVRILLQEILPEMFQLAAKGKLVVKTTVVALPQIADIWDIAVKDGQRLVVTI